MRKPFIELSERLLRAGLAPRHVRRYVAELGDHLADLTAEEERVGRSRTDAESAALVRLGSLDDLTNAMIGQRQFQSWSARAPWAIFGLAPTLLLAAAYFVACFILWSGWKIFMPGAETPFGGLIPGPIYGIENLYFQAGRMIYFNAPILIGWGIGAVAARQRMSAFWPTVGFVLIASMGGTAQVSASRPNLHGEGGHVNMVLSLGPSLQTLSSHLFRILLALSLMVLPYLIWRLQRARSLSA